MLWLRIKKANTGFEREETRRTKERRNIKKKEKTTANTTEIAGKLPFCLKERKNKQITKEQKNKNKKNREGLGEAGPFGHHLTLNLLKPKPPNETNTPLKKTNKVRLGEVRWPKANLNLPKPKPNKNKKNKTSKASFLTFWKKLSENKKREKALQK